MTTEQTPPSVIDQAAEVIAYEKNKHRVALSEFEETFIEYRPNAGVEKWFKQRFSAFSELKAWFAMTLAVLFFYFGGPGLIIEAIVNIFVGGAGANASGAAAAASQLILYVLYAVFGGLAAAITIG